MLRFDDDTTNNLARVNRVLVWQIYMFDFSFFRKPINHEGTL